MTKTYFIEEINYWWELIDFCNEYGCSICGNVYDEETVDDFIKEDIDYLFGSEPWENIGSQLSQFYSGSEYYRRDGALDYVALDDYDFAYNKDDVLEWAEEEGVFEEEGEAEESVDEDEEKELTPQLEVTQSGSSQDEAEAPSVDDIFSLFEVG